MVLGYLNLYHRSALQYDTYSRKKVFESYEWGITQEIDVNWYFKVFDRMKFELSHCGSNSTNMLQPRVACGNFYDATFDKFGGYEGFTYRDRIRNLTKGEDKNSVLGDRILTRLT